MKADAWTMRLVAGLVVWAAVLTATVRADLIMSYDSGVAAAWGAGAGAANPTNQGWTRNVSANNLYLGGFDSTNGGWRTVDGASSGYASYGRDLTTGESASLSNGWRITFSLAVDRHAWTTNNTIGVSNYYYPPNQGRQNNSGLWFEGSSFRFSLYFGIDASTNLFVNDQTSTFTLSGDPYETFRTFVVEGTNNVATMSVGAQSFTLTGASLINDNRLLFGSHTSAGQGSLVWNSVTLESIPEPATAGLLGLFSGALLLRMRRCRRGTS